MQRYGQFDLLLASHRHGSLGWRTDVSKIITNHHAEDSRRPVIDDLEGDFFTLIRCDLNDIHPSDLNRHGLRAINGRILTAISRAGIVLTLHHKPEWNRGQRRRPHVMGSIGTRVVLDE